MKQAKTTTTISPIKWTKEWATVGYGSKPYRKTGEYHEIRWGNIRSYVYGGYTRESQYRNGCGWWVQLRMDNTSPPNKLAPRTQYTKLKDAKNATLAAGVLFIALCLIKNKKPEDMEMYE